MRIRVGHLYPDYLNIYADRGNIAVFERRAALRGHELDVAAVSIGDELEPGAHDLLYVGGGQDREQALVAPDLAAKGESSGRGRACAALLAVCGGYQLLGRGYRGRDGVELPGVGLFPHETVAGDRRMIGDVLLECELEPGRGGRSRASRTTPAARAWTGAEPLGRVVAGFGNDGESGYEGCRLGRAVGTYLHGPLLPRNPWLADWLLAQALAHATGGEPPGSSRYRTGSRRGSRFAAQRAQSAGVASTGRALASVDVGLGRRQFETEIRIAARPCQVVPESQQVPSSWTRRTTSRVSSSSSPKRTSTWLRTTSLRISTPARRRGARRTASAAQQPLDQLGDARRPSERSAA